MRLLYVLLLAAIVPLVSSAAPPAGIVNYTKVIIVYNGLATFPSSFQQMITANVLNYTSVMTYNGNSANFELYYANDTVIPAWIESNSSNTLTIWANVVGGFYAPTSSATSTNTLYLGFASKTTNLLSSTGTTGIGEAPQLSPTYAEYDDGASVFTNYWNFAGTALPSSWTQSGGILTVDNGLTYEFDGNGDSLSTPSINFETNITDYYGYLSGGAAFYSSTFAFLYPVGFGIGFTGYGGVYGVDNNNNHVTISPSTDIDTGNILISFYANSSDTFASINNNPYTSVGGAPGTAPPTTGGFYWSSAFTSSGTYGYIQWLNTRALPPNGAMPSVYFGALHVILSISPNPPTYGQSINITATCPLSTDTCAIDYPSLGTAIATGTGSATYTYNAFSLSANSYSTYYANDITLGTNSIGQTLTINTITPTLSLPNFPTNYSYNGNPATITANIISHNNQLNGNLYLSSALVASTNTQTTYSTSASAGTYAFTFNTLGNANYTSASVSNTLQISKNSTYTLAWLKKGTNQTWSNTPINTTAQITTHNNQLSASLYLNSGFIATTTTTTTTTQLNKIGFYHYVFNTTGNTNYTANSITYTFWADVPISIENISATGTALTKSINYSKSPFTWNTYYPAKLYTSSPSNTINYTLTQNLAGTPTTLSTNALNISYIPPANQITGNYIYSILERQSNDSQTLTLTIAANTLNMEDIGSAINFSSLIQYFPILAHNPTWTAKPTSWYVASSTLVPQITQNTSAGAVFSTNVIGAFTPQIHLVYPFASFLLNYTNNPAVQKTITIQPFQYTLANSIIASLRNIANLTIYNQETFNSIAGANAAFAIPTTFNNYIFANTVSNNTDTNGKYFLQIPKSNYLNPNITFQLNGTIIKPLFFAPLQLFCPSSVGFGSAAAYQIGLVDTNGTKYSFYVYTNTGTSAQNYILFLNELQGVSARSAESLVIPSSLPMAVPLEQTGQEYQYIVYSPNCKSVYYKGSFIDPTNPTYITLTTGASQAVFYNTTNVTGACALNSSTNPYKLVCAASDSESQVYKYKLDIFNATNVLGSTELVKQVYENTSTFAYNALLPVNETYSYTLYAYAFKNVDPVFLVNGGSLIIQRIQYSAPLLGVFAFILMITLVFVGIKSGKAIILVLLFNVGLLAVAMFGLAQIPTAVSAIFIIVGIIVSMWSIKAR